MRLGIDFGTCFSHAALMMAEESLQMVKDPIKHGYSFPSSLHVTKRGELLIGSVAENARQQVVDTRPTDDPEQHDMVCATVRPGYLFHCKFILTLLCP